MVNGPNKNCSYCPLAFSKRAQKLGHLSACARGRRTPIRCHLQLIKHGRRPTTSKSFGFDLIPKFESLDYFHFSEQLHGKVKVSWSRFEGKMADASGCTYDRNKKIKMIRIFLNWPLLRKYTRKIIYNVLLHEMIHAYLFVTNSTDVNSHGSDFCRLMKKINAESDLNVTIDFSPV